MTDDLDVATLNTAIAAGFMPNLKKLVIDKGFTFSNFYASDALCCPSRATFLTGQYPHNHGVTDNMVPWNIAAFRDTSTLPVWLHAAGYQTALIGKYLNMYGQVDVNHDGVIDQADALYIPPGWDDWEALFAGCTLQYGCTVSDNGKLVTYGSSTADYQTDMLSSRAVAFVQRAKVPFFLELTPTAPHVEAAVGVNWPPAQYSDMWKLGIRPPSRYTGTVNLTLPQGPSFNEADVSDKTWINPSIIPQLTSTDITNLQKQYNGRIGAIRAVDDMVSSVLQAVSAKGQWDNTVFVFTSDNGFLLGQHRLSEKEAMYEEAVRIPLYVRRLAQSTPYTVNALLSMNDMAPTISAWATATPTLTIDGTSFVPLFTTPTAPWRLRLGLEHWDHSQPGGVTYIPEYHGVRTSAALGGTPNMVFTRYVDGSVELYDLNTDPNQLGNIAGSPARASQLAALSSQAASLATCLGSGCNSLEFR